MIFYIIYSGIGKLFIFLIQKSPYSKYFISLFRGGGRAFLEELFGCGLCLGFWVYFLLALVFDWADIDVYIIDVQHAHIISAIITGAVTSFIVHVFSVGWKDLFGVFEVGGE